MGGLSQGVAMHAYNGSIEEAGGRELTALWVQGQPGLQNESQISLSYSETLPPKQVGVGG